MSFNLSPPTVVLSSITAPQTFVPLVANDVIPQGLDVTADNFVSVIFSGKEPPGEYFCFVAWARPGSFLDGRIDPGDIVAIAVERFTFAP